MEHDVDHMAAKRASYTSPLPCLSRNGPCWLVVTQILDENIRKVKLSTPDYRDMDPEEAMTDFKKRRENYMASYEPVETKDGPHIKIINSKKFIGKLLSSVSILERQCTSMENPSN